MERTPAPVLGLFEERQGGVPDRVTKFSTDTSSQLTTLVVNPTQPLSVLEISLSRLPQPRPNESSGLPLEVTLRQLPVVLRSNSLALRGVGVEDEERHMVAYGRGRTPAVGRPVEPLVLPPPREEPGK